MSRRFIALLIALCLLSGLFTLALAEDSELDILQGPDDEAMVLELEEDIAFDDEAEAIPAEVDVDLIPDDLILYEADAPERTELSSSPVSNALQKLVITYTGGTLYKTYDKSRNYQGTNSTTGKTEWLLNKTLKKSDFKVNTEKDHSDVSISLTGATLTKFSAADAGDYTLSLTLQLTGGDLEYYDLEKTDGKYYATVDIPARIDKRPVTITPSKSGTIKDSQGNESAYVASKAYGEADPSWFLFTQKGLLNLTTAEQQAGKKLYTGKLGREPGEDVGTYKFTLGTLDFGNSNYEVKLNDEVFTITKKTISDSDIGMVTIGNERYTGKEIKPTVTLRYGAMTLKEGTDFTVEYKDNVSAGSNTAKVIITGIGNFTGTKETTFSIIGFNSQSSITADDITVSKVPDQAYTGKKIKPDVKIQHGQTTLKEGTDYFLTYQSNKTVGTATITINGTGNYTGTRNVTFKIVPKGTSLSKLTAGKKKIAVKWKKNSSVTGYQVAYRLKGSSSWKSKTVKGAKNVKLTLKSLKSKKTYYVRIRTYKKVNGKNYYSAWSKTKKVKVK